MGHNSFVYLDDGFGSQPERTSAVAAPFFQRKDLPSSGLLVNESHWVPMQVGEWLGFVINTISMTFQIPEKKVYKLKRLLNSVIQNKSSSYRELARIAGSIISVALAVGPISIESFNGYSIRPPLDSSTVAFSGASDAAFGGFSASLDGTVASGMFTTDDLGQSSTFRELKAIYYVLLSFIEHLKRKRVKIFTDNQSATRIVSVGRSKVHLQSVALSIFRFCFSHDIALEAQWIPRSLNDRADLLSRFVDKDDWRVNPSVFRLVDAKWGPHAIDRFASYYKAQLPRFNSKFASPGCSGVDALVQDWSGENNWVCPPVGLVVDAVQVLTACSGTLIIPEWPSAYFWPLYLT
ncbi:uncharacterized protein [Montipora foliosa]|uniref:uncharacterized protein n=1 Tax=Montipora foliosa TaxID=591990 RepID=UPI0035F1949D